MSTTEVHVDARRDELLANLARLYALREDMRRANKPLLVHGLTIAIKMRTGTLRAFDRADFPAQPAIARRQ